jgi:hypothetical protein
MSNSNNNTKKYAVMLFMTEIELGISSEPNKWVNYRNVYFDNGTEALWFYANTPCPASQLIEASDDYELQCKMGEMMLNYMDDDWLNKHLYPFL